jgi:hypothetical protein
MCYKGVTRTASLRPLQPPLTMSVTGVLQGCYKSVTGVLQGALCTSAPSAASLFRLSAATCNKSVTGCYKYVANVKNVTGWRTFADLATTALSPAKHSSISLLQGRYGGVTRVLQRFCKVSKGL